MNWEQAERVDVDVRTLVFSFYTHRLCTPTITNILQYLCLHRLRAWTDMDLREERDDGGKKGGRGWKDRRYEWKWRRWECWCLAGEVGFTLQKRRWRCSQGWGVRRRISGKPGMKGVEKKTGVERKGSGEHERIKDSRRRGEGGRAGVVWHS